MTEDEKMQVAVFRFGVISDFVNGDPDEPCRAKAADGGEVRPQMANPFFGKDQDYQRALSDDGFGSTVPAMVI